MSRLPPDPSFPRELKALGGACKGFQFKPVSLAYQRASALAAVRLRKLLNRF